MELKEIACVTGRPGLFRIIKPLHKGILVETLESPKRKLALGVREKVAILQEITFYTDDAEGAYPLVDLLYDIKAKYNDKLPVHYKEDNDDAIMNFFAELLPQYSRGRVQAHDVRKLLKWYDILLKEAPEALVRPAEKDVEQEAKAGHTAKSQTQKEDPA